MPIPQSYDNFGVSFTYNISSKSIKESVNPEQVKKSSEQEAPNGVHLAVLNHLDEVIGESIEVEEHPDYKKDENGERKPENGWNDDVLVHRFVGAITVDGQTYRVKTTMLEYAQKDWGDCQYAYDVAKIEVLDKTPNTPNGLDEANKGLYPLANILKNIEKSYDPGKLLLDESAKEDRKREIQNTQNGFGGGRARFMVSSESDADYMDAVEKGDVVYADIPYENTHQDGYRGGKFDKQAFVEWAQAQDVPVYVSEYSMPEDWTEVASFDVRGVRGGKRPEKLFVQSKFAGEYERRMQEESGDDVRFMRGSELEEMRRRPLVTRSHPVPTDEELRESFERGFVHENRDGSRRLLAAARERFGTNDMDEAFEKWKQEQLELHRQHEKIRSLEKFLRENATQISKSRQSQSTYYHYKGTTYRFSDHVYPTGSMTKRWADGTFDRVDLTADPYLIDEVAREVDGKVVPLSAEAEDDVRFMTQAEIEEVNRKFNDDLQKQINGELPAGYVYDMGLPSDVLQSTGFPNVPIELSASHLSAKANAAHHRFDISEMKDLVKAIRKPMAVFAYGIPSKSQNVIVEIQHDGKNFVVGIHFNQRRGNAEVSSIRGLYPKDNAEWLNWINQDKLLYADKEKIQALIDQQRRILADVEYLDLDSVANILNNFENPALPSENNSQPTENGGGRAAFMVSEERDAEYMDAVEKGDEEKAGRMVREAARRAMPETKVVDENGEPKVVLHGTPDSSFYEFDDEKIGSNTDAGWLGRGFYFYGNNPEYARQYAGGTGRVLHVYLDIRNPYYATSEDIERLSEANDPEVSRQFREQLEEEGYDGVYYNGDLNEEWVAFHPNQIKLSDPVTRDDRGNVIPLSERFNPEKDDIRFMSSEELDEKYPNWLKDQTEESGKHSTQIAGTLNSYKKFGEWVKKVSGGRQVSVLDASSGLGYGTEWLRENGIDADDVEPYPSSGRKAPTFSSYDDIDKKYDFIISNAVLNVIPDDWRAGLLHDMADKLNVGGKLIINVRGANSIRNQGKEGVTKITLDDPSEVLVLRPNGSVRAYQKGFTKEELKEWCEKELGDGYTVEAANQKNAGGTYDTAVVVTKTADADGDVRFMSESDDIGEREAKNVIIDSSEEHSIPRTREDALAMIPKGGITFTNKDQGVDIRVGRKALRHSNLHGEDFVYKAFGKIREIVEESIKIGEEPVAGDEIGKTKSVSIYYVPVNVDGTQYSARLVVKELEHKGVVLDEMMLYNVSMHKEKTPSHTNVGTSLSDGLAQYGGVKSAYKIKDLIHFSQENDLKILGLEKDQALFMSDEGGEAEGSEVRDGDGLLGDVPGGDELASEAELEAHETRVPLDEALVNGLMKLARDNKDNVELRVRAMRSIGGSLGKLRQAMARQREYDRGTVDTIVRIAKTMLGSGIYKQLGNYQVRRLLGMVNAAAGRENITKQAQGVVDILTAG